MDPAVMAAIIGVSGTVVVGVAGFGASIWNARKTIAHARESRVWDQRAAVYVDALAAVHYRNVRREYEMRTKPMDDEFKQRAQVLLATYKAPDFHDLEARLQAFASEPVVTAVQRSSSAHEHAAAAFLSWREVSTMPDVPDGRIVLEAMHVGHAFKSADNADDAVVELIRAELQGKGKPLGDWQPTAALPSDAAEGLETGKTQPKDSGT